jgi:anti-sigma28 factor (negative regulator of flagellin synthesis)
MKVYDQNLTGTSVAESGRSQEAQRTGRTGSQAAGTTASGSDDHIELSDTLNSLSRAMSSYSGSRGAKVQALATQYRSGTYHGDSLATSRGMVTEALAAEGR